MKTTALLLTATLLWLGATLALAGGGKRAWYQSPSVDPLGTQSDTIWRRQEANAEASDFVVYEHEFRMSTARLNMGGEDHLKAIAMRLRGGDDFPVIVERSMTSVDPKSENKYPIHPNSELDMQRRDLVVRALTAMGVPDAEQRVLVAPALTPGATATEAARAYQHGLNYNGFFGSGYGGFGGAWFGGYSGYGN